MTTLHDEQARINALDHDGEWGLAQSAFLGQLLDELDALGRRSSHQESVYGRIQTLRDHFQDYYLGDGTREREELKPMITRVVNDYEEAMRQRSGHNNSPPEQQPVSTDAIADTILKRLEDYLATDDDGRPTKAASKSQVDDHETRIRNLEERGAQTDQDFDLKKFGISVVIGAVTGLLLGLFFTLIGWGLFGWLGGIAWGALIGGIAGIFVGLHKDEEQ